MTRLAQDGLPGPCVGPERGFTLLEVLMSVAILGIGVLAAIQLLSGGLRLTRTADAHVDIVFAAREKMAETLLQTRFFEGTKKGADRDIGWTVSISRYNAENDTPGKRMIMVTVTAEDLRNSGRNYSLTTLKTLPVE